MPLFIVPTPLGNLRDITLRAMDVLQQAELIVSEDTRVTLRLLHALDITPPEIWSFHAQSSEHALHRIIAHAAEQRVAFVSDAGMPGVSDPGGELVRAARSAGVGLEVLPGPCAFISAGVLSGFPIVGLRFAGFVPRTAGARREAFRQELLRGESSVWYESPHRLDAALATLADLAPATIMFVLREYTKRFEQHLLGTPAEIRAALPQPVKGEITIVLRGSEADRATLAAPPLHPDARMRQLLAEGHSTAEVAKRLAAEGFGNRRALYRHICDYEHRQLPETSES